MVGLIPQVHRQHRTLRLHVAASACHLGPTAAGASVVRDAAPWSVHCPEPCRESGRDCHLLASEDAQEVQAGEKEMLFRRQVAQPPVAQQAGAHERLQAFPVEDAPQLAVPELARDEGWRWELPLAQQRMLELRPVLQVSRLPAQVQQQALLSA
jgi:hypothetical protein